MATPEVRGRPARASTTIHREPPSKIEISVIPVGTVQRLRNQVEARITPEVPVPDDVLLIRAQDHASALRQSRRTYKQRLRVAAEIGLFRMSPSLTRFIHDHDNMTRAVARSTELARRARNSSGVDTLTYVNICIIAVRNRLSRTWTITTFSSCAREALKATGTIGPAIETLRGMLEDVVVHILTLWDELSLRYLDENQLKNVGPDHNIDDFGHETTVGVAGEHRVNGPISDDKMGHAQSKGNTNSLPTPPPSPARIHISNGTLVDDNLDDNDDGDDDKEDDYSNSDDDSYHCSICTDPYTNRHRAFSLTRCGHIFGKACLSTWINSTARNANLCPHCRATISPG
ncbi:uncharacterized protein CC84DRAFT_1209952 [Paraphaeosphaeria sporulosa]|uniref:RING-type domain-containing protein n=1 Tax=Paraphaeosphaeria sporulosa TaxID=1460663 RepID=A0A177BVV3_9PLEO|nr:uncharacterized protein CC84DRAFT_1209952 [Paraphaeosphaeria sporulosa]OAF99623.1 hypothetical protein CC84DRAFT_1209952 [Paraphaeosphaeria sporulosa]